MKHLNTPGLAEVGLGRNNRWNELHFVTRETFATMAPSVLRLEIDRLAGCLSGLTPDHDAYDAVAGARARLVTLRGLVGRDDFLTGDLSRCESLLSGAVLALAIRTRPAGDRIDAVLDNIADRLGYVLERLARLR